MPGDGRKRSFLLKHRHSWIVGIVHVEFLGDAVSGDGILEDLLEVDAVILIEEPAAGDEAGPVIQGYDRGKGRGACQPDTFQWKTLPRRLSGPLSLVQMPLSGCSSL